MLVWEGFRRTIGWGLCRFDAWMRRIQTQEWARFVQVWCKLEKDSVARVGEICAGLMLIWEGFRRRSGRGLCRFDASLRRIQMQEWVRFVQVWCSYEKDLDAGVSEVCAVLMLVWEGFRRTIGWGLCRFDAWMRRIQTQEWARFVQVWCKLEKDSDARVVEVCAVLMLVWEGFRRTIGWGLCRFDAWMRRIQTQEWARFVQVWCKLEKDSDARVVEVCAVLMLVWEGFRRTIGWGLCRFDAWMRRIQTQEWARFVQVWCKLEKDSVARVGEICAGLMLIWEGFRRRSGRGLCRFDASLRRIQMQEWVRFVQVWCSYEKDLDAGVSEVCAVLMLVWEGFRRTIGWGLCRFDAWMRRIQTQEWARFVQVWCKLEKDSDARVVEVCAVLMLVWEGFRRTIGWGLCRFDAWMRRIQTQEWARFVQVWCKLEKDSDARVGEICAGLMLIWEGFRRRSGRGLCRFDASLRRIQMQEWVRFVQVWCSYEKDLDAGVSEVCAVLMLVWEGFRRTIGWGLCRFDAWMRRIQTQEWARFVQVWCKLEKDSDARVVEVCAVLMLVWEGFRRTIGWGLCRFDAWMRRIQTQEWARFVQVWCKLEKDSDARVGEICAGLMLIWEGFRRRSGRGLCRFDASLRRIQMHEWLSFCAVLMLVWEGFRRTIGWGLCRFDAYLRRIQTQEWVRFVQTWCLFEKDSDAGVGEVCAGLMQAWEGFRCKSGWDLCRFDAHMRRI